MGIKRVNGIYTEWKTKPTNKLIGEKRMVGVQLKATYEWEKCNSYVIWKTDSCIEVNDDFNGENLFLCKYNIHPEVWWDI